MKALTDQEMIEKYYDFMMYYYRWVDNDTTSAISGNTLVGISYIVSDITPNSVLNLQEKLLLQLYNDDIIEPYNQLSDLWKISDRAHEVFKSLCLL